MKRVVLIAISVVIGLCGLLAASNGLFGALFGGVGGLLSLSLGGGLLVAAVLILRSQVPQSPGSEATEAQRAQLRTGLRILLVILALLAGLVGLFLSLCGMLVNGSSGSNEAAMLIVIGVVLVVVAIMLIVKAVKMR